MSDESTELWMSRARTPEARARILRWSRWQRVSGLILLLGSVLFVAAIPVGIGLAIWFWVTGIGRPEVFFWLYGVGVGVCVLGVFLEHASSTRLAEAHFADGRSTVGVVEALVEGTERDDVGSPLYDAAVSATIDEGLTIHRVIVPGPFQPSADASWIGRRIRFRHNTLDPDDLHDVRFDSWADDPPYENGENR